MVFWCQLDEVTIGACSSHGRICKFASLPEAERWIAEHLWLTEQVTQRSTQQQPDILDNKG